MLTYFDIPYTARPDPDLCLDIFAPEDVPCRATVVWLHGGGIENGSRKGVDRLAKSLCARGFAMVSAEYRLFPNAKYPDFLVDAAEAVRWTADHAIGYGLSETILLGGSSAGAYITMMLCFDRQYLAAVELNPEALAGYLFDAGQPTTHFNVLKYRDVDPRRLIVDEAGPLFHIQNAQPDRPILITVSDNDMPARLEQNQLLMATMKHFGYDMDKVEFHLMKGFKHTGYTHAADAEGRMIYGDLVAGFIERHITAEST
ncbi:MAG: alpha/beta hydrolase [Clostridia bacterium]|nr:alpha/beta hydrolase [Clostridia bacterium]